MLKFLQRYPQSYYRALQNNRNNFYKLKYWSSTSSIQKSLENDNENEFLKIINSIDGKRNLEPRELISLIGYLKENDVSRSKHLSLIIEKCFLIENADLHHALEENIKVKLRITDMIKEAIEQREIEEFELRRKKMIRKLSFSFKLFLASLALTTAFRIYFYLEYEVDPLHPRVSDYLIYRFK
jgi:hypothetical protein